MLVAALALVVSSCDDDETGPPPPPPPPAGSGGTAGGGGDVGGGGSGGGGGGGGGSEPDYVVEVCTGAPTADPGADVCAVNAGDGRLFIVGDVLTPGTVYEQGGVLVDLMGTIECVGCDCVDDAAGATEIICPDAVISAGLVNAHDHFGWMNGEPWVAADEGVDPALRWEHRHDWRRGNRGHPEIDEAGGGADTDERIFGELRFVLSGATAAFGSGDLGGLLRDLDDTGEGDNGLGLPGAEYDTFPLGDSSGTQLVEGCEAYSVMNAVPSYFNCHAPHVSEGICDVARNELHCVTGLGAGSKSVLDDRSAIIHGIGFGAQEVGYLAAVGIDLIWSPRSNVALYGDTAPVTLYERLGVGIGLGTDWLPSGSMNMLRELACAAHLNEDYFGGYFSDHRLWQMATVGGARALAFDDAIGTLAAGLVGDIAVYANHGRQHYRSVVAAGVEDVALVLRGGLVLSGNAAVVAELEADCETVDVCSVSKQVCVSRDTGRTLAAIEGSINPRYPLFFCDTPDDEPSCTPARTLANDSIDSSTLYGGSSSADDPDADGINDAHDNCPNVFNPTRPVDHGVQADWDGDGEGDACDPCPFDADTSTCTTVIDPDDRDADSVPNGSDNCPVDYNPLQEDAEPDGKGDACDACPNDANPGDMLCPGIATTIYAVQDVNHVDHPDEGTRVQVDCIITALSARMAWCQDAGGGHYSGIAVYAGSTPVLDDGFTPVSLGDRVTLHGDYHESYGVSELTNPTFVFQSSGTVPPPELVTPAAVATGGSLAEAYEGVFIRVQNVTVTDDNPDDPNDYDEFEVTGGLRIDDLVVDGGGTGGQLDNTFSVGTAFVDIAGVHHYSYNDFKLLPRRVSDLQQQAPTLAGFSPDEIYVEVGGGVLPSELTITLTGLAVGDTTVGLQSGNDAVASVPTSVVVLDGTDSVVVPVTGVLAQLPPVTLTASLGVTDVYATAHVYDDTLPRSLVSITPDQAQVLVNATATFTLTLDLPAPSGGAAVGLSVTNGIGSTNPQETIVAGAFSTDFTFTAASSEASGLIIATLGTSTVQATVDVLAANPGFFVINEVDYDQIGTDYEEFLELYNGTLSSVDLTGHRLIFVNGANGTIYREIDLQPAGALPASGFLVVHSVGVTPDAGAISLPVLPDSDGIQNGGPDGIALVSPTVVIDAISYEGAMTSVALGAPYGTVSLTSGTPISEQDSNSVVRSLCRATDGEDTGDDDADWTQTSTPTPGSGNFVN